MTIKYVPSQAKDVKISPDVLGLNKRLQYLQLVMLNI